MQDYSFQILFESLGLIAAPMYRSNDDERVLLNRVFERLRQRMVEALYAEA